MIHFFPLSIAVLFIFNSNMTPRDVFRQLFLEENEKIDDVITTNCVFQPKIDNIDNFLSF